MIGARCFSSVWRNAAASAGLSQNDVAPWARKAAFSASLASAFLQKADAFSTIAGGRPAGPHKPPQEAIWKPG